MHCPTAAPIRPAGRRPWWQLLLGAAMALVYCCFCSGCAALSNPVYEGIPVSRLPREYLVSPKDETHTIPLNSLRRQAPDAYRLDAGDVLGVYVEGLIGDKNQPVPVRLPEAGTAAPALG